MGILCFIYGKSGSGKSRSLKNFAEDEIFLVNVSKKPLPFRKKFKYEYPADDVGRIANGLSKMPCKVAVIDDAGYLQTNAFMNGHAAPKKGSSQFDLYNDIADSFYRLLTFIRDNLPNDVIVYVMMHEETSDYGDTKLRTIGKLLDQKVCLEGMSTIVLRCMTEGKEHFFRTQTDGSDITKSPEEMFESDRIENDLKYVTDKIREYYDFEPQKGEEE